MIQILIQTCFKKPIATGIAAGVAVATVALASGTLSCIEARAQTFQTPVSALATPSQSPAIKEISVVQFNTWGVPFSTYDHWRYAEAMDQISAMAPDFVFLDEVFSGKGRRGYHDPERYPYQVSGPRALPKLVSSGLRILSKYPIERSAKLVYSGCVKDDCLARKGALLAVIRLPSGQKLTLVATHLNARGEDDVRLNQVEQLQAFIEYFQEEGTPILIGGDFNFPPDSSVYPVLVSALQLQDTWPLTHEISDPGYTSDAENNVYAHDYSIKYGFPLARERIDYLLTHGLAPIESRLIFDQGTLYSDHFGLSARFRLPSPTN